MFTSFDQVKDWIIDNGFKRWVLYRDRSKTEKIIDSTSFVVSDMDDKIAMTEKYLRMAGGSAYAAGATTNSRDDLTTVAEIRLESAQASTAGVGTMQPVQQLDEEKIAQRIEAKLRAEYEKKEYERKREELDKERKAFEAEKASAMGALAHYFAPIGQAILNGGQRRMVAGVDTQEPIRANVIQPITTDQQTQEEDPFTDEEADELFTLMARFKKVEPEYMAMIRKVVEMAESGDATYTMAKQFLCQ